MSRRHALPLRQEFERFWRHLGSLAAWYRPGVGVTGALNASAWADQSGNGRDLLQTTGANQPIYLAHDGTNYLSIQAGAGNDASCASSAGLESATGDVAVVVRVAMDDWTPAANADVLSKDAGGTWHFWVNTTGLLRFDVGAVTHVSTAAVGVSDGTPKYIAATLDADNGAGGHAVKFYTSDDGIAFTQLGATATEQTNVLVVAQTADPVLIGGRAGGGQGPAKHYLAKIYKGIPAALGGAGGETLEMHVDFTQAAEGATTFAELSANAAEVTINSSGATPAQIVGSPQLLFDGTSHFMAAVIPGLAQPESIYLVLNQVSWTSDETIFDGVPGSDNTRKLHQSGAAPNVGIYAGAEPATVAGPAIGAYGIVTSVFDGANSLVQLNSAAASTGNAGAGNSGGLTLAQHGSYGGLRSNIQVTELLIFAAAHNAATRLAIQQRLAALHGIAL